MSDLAQRFDEIEGETDTGNISQLSIIRLRETEHDNYLLYFNPTSVSCCSLRAVGREGSNTTTLIKISHSTPCIFILCNPAQFVDMKNCQMSRNPPGNIRTVASSVGGDISTSLTRSTFLATAGRDHKEQHEQSLARVIIRTENPELSESATKIFNSIGKKTDQKRVLIFVPCFAVALYPISIGRFFWLLTKSIFVISEDILHLYWNL